MKDYFTRPDQSDRTRQSYRATETIWGLEEAEASDFKLAFALMVSGMFLAGCALALPLL